MNYNQKGSILFLSICSGHKENGGDSSFDEGSAIFSLLPAEIKAEFLKRRNELRELITKTESLKDQGIPLSDAPSNDKLVGGKDFGGDRKAEYCPAIKRYKGRFFKELGEDGKQKLLDSSRHTLFLSGLYGVVRPLEPIQNYNCFVEQRISDIWNREKFLTKVLCEYVNHYSIKRIFDFTGMNTYRALIAWDILSKHARVLHCHSHMNAGENALMDFAELMKVKFFDMSEDALLEIKTDDEIMGIRFSNSASPPEGFPREELKNISVPVVKTDRNDDVPPDNIVTVKSKFSQAESEWIIDYSEFSSANYKHLRKEIDKAVQVIRMEPMTPHGDTVKALTGDLKGKWRYRLHGDYRLVYEPDSKRREIKLIKIAHRKDVYE